MSIGIKVQRQMKAEFGVPTVDEIREMVRTSENAQNRALVAIYNGQTHSEKESHTTVEDNGIGFSGIDAEILTSFAEQFLRRQFLSPKQRAILAKKMPKYAGQLWQIAVRKKGATLTAAPVAAPVVKPAAKPVMSEAARLIAKQIANLADDIANQHEAMEGQDDPKMDAYLASLEAEIVKKERLLQLTLLAENPNA